MIAARIRQQHGELDTGASDTTCAGRSSMLHCANMPTLSACAPGTSKKRSGLYEGMTSTPMSTACIRALRCAARVHCCNSAPTCEMPHLCGLLGRGRPVIIVVTRIAVRAPSDESYYERPYRQQHARLRLMLVFCAVPVPAPRASKWSMLAVVTACIPCDDSRRKIGERCQRASR